MKKEDYPALYQASDSFAQKSQRKYILTILIYIFSLSMLAAKSLFYEFTDNYSNIIVIIILLILLIDIIFMLSKKYNNSWYKSRALAESIKTITWKYIMKSKPYSQDDDKSNTRQFIKDCRRLINQNEDISKKMPNEYADKESITSFMEKIRRKTVKKRLKIYKKERIQDQRKWYKEKARYNSILRKLFLIIIFILILGILLLNIMGFSDYIFFNMTSFIVTIAASILTWMQTKKYEELSSSYNLAAHEIGMIETLSKEVKTEKDLSSFVDSAENAFSREHTQWAARRY